MERQVARMWLAPEGAVSPLHFDGHTSFLTQVRCSCNACLSPAVVMPSCPDGSAG